MSNYKFLTNDNIQQLTRAIADSGLGKMISTGRNSRLDPAEIHKATDAIVGPWITEIADIEDIRLKHERMTEIIHWRLQFFMGQYPVSKMDYLNEFKTDLTNLIQTDNDESKEALSELNENLEKLLAGKPSWEEMEVFRFPVIKLYCLLKRGTPGSIVLEEMMMLCTMLEMYSNSTNPNSEANNIMENNKIEFDGSVAEDALQEYMEANLGELVAIFESTTTGVIAFERLSSYDVPKVDYQSLAADLSEKMGVNVVCIANCDWSFSDKCDEEATYIAFDVPDLDPDYRNDARNLIDNHNQLKP